MGNCLRHQSSTRYATDDDWDNFPAAEGGSFAESSNGSGGTGKTTTTTTKTITEVKIKITKKQLEELLGKVDVKELRVEQVLAQLMNRSRGYDSLQRPWRPALQSIPEVN